MDMREILAGTHTIAVVGYSNDPARAGHYVSQYMLRAGYTVIPVNPKYGAEVDGLACYPSLSALPAGLEVDTVDVFRNPAHVPAIAREAATLDPRPKWFWMQPGAESEEAAQVCRDAGITPLYACMMAEHRRL